MNMIDVFSNVNFVAVLVAALSSFLVGWLWYGPLFGRKWMKLNGFTEADIKEGGLPMPLIMGVNYVATALAALAIAMFLGDEAGVGFGLFIGFMIALFWIATSRLNDVLYERKPFGLFLINVGYNLVIYMLMGAILSIWH
ncbi:MAG TPA: DUF1761 domain-containing protein [Prolixibacteraceae bacterium]|nr:DUF1761 domain-containing protein [Prolixibacteraceae bacterium]